MIAELKDQVASAVSAMSAPLPITPTIFWMFVMLQIAFYEGLQLGSANGVPATTVLRTMRFNALGRFIICPLFVWLAWHIVFRPRAVAPMTGWDMIPIAIGLAMAFVTGGAYALGGVVR